MQQASENQNINSRNGASNHESSISSTFPIRLRTNLQNTPYNLIREGLESEECKKFLWCWIKRGREEKKPKRFRPWSATMIVADDCDHPQLALMKREERGAHRHNQKIDVLEREVRMLENMLGNEQGLHQVLKRALHGENPGSAISIPAFVPPEVTTLLMELGEVDDEIARLERQIGELQSDLKLEESVNEVLKSGNQSQRVTFEAKSLHFISKAMKGDFTVNNEFSPLRAQMSEENGAPRRYGTLQKPPVSPSKASPRLNLTPKREREQRVSSEHQPNSSTSSANAEAHSGKQKAPSPNKLSESIMKCLIFIYVRLHRTTRQNELEKEGGSAASRTFRGNSANVKAIQVPHKESRQQDPYGIFDDEESIPRDIGPYKNLILFSSSSLDLKLLSSPSFIPLLRNLRGLFDDLRKAKLQMLTPNQKLAFWINVYNSCVMNGFLQYGVPSSPEKLLTLMNEATLNIGGNFLNAQAIENFILRKSSISSEEKESREDAARQLYGLEAHNPNVTFALCCGTRSSPSVRIYTSEGVVLELERSKLEYLQASIMVTSTSKIAIPELLMKNLKNFADDNESLVKWVCRQLPVSGLLRKSMVDCFKGHKTGALIEKIAYNFEFQYLLGNISCPY